MKLNILELKHCLHLVGICGIDNAMQAFNANQLRKGDYCLLKPKRGAKPQAVHVIHAKAYQSIGVQFPDGSQEWFDSRRGFSAIIAGARLINGEWKAL